MLSLSVLVVAAVLIVVPRLPPRGVPGEGLLTPFVNPSPRPGCPDREPEGRGLVTLESGASSLLWCPIAQEWDQHPPHLPTEPLTRGLDEWTRTFNSLPKVVTGLPCAGVGRPTLAYVISYPDQTTVTMAGDSGGCSGMGGRADVKQIEDLTLRLFQQQRSSGFAPPAAQFNACNPSESVFPARFELVTSIALCEWNPDGSALGTIDGAAARIIVDELVARSIPDDSDPGTVTYQAQLLQPNGERRPLYYDDQHGSFGWQDDAGSWWRWRPTRNSLATLRDALTRSGRSGCRLPLAEVLPPGSALPVRPTKVWYCSHTRHAPIDPLTSHLDEMVAATAKFTRCVQGESLLAEYRDGTRLRLLLGDPTCTEVLSETAPAPTVAAAFVRLLAQQRAAADQIPSAIPPPPAQEGGLCETALRSIMPVTPQQATGTVFCDVSKRTLITPREDEGIAFSSDDHRVLVRELLAGSRPVTTGAPRVQDLRPKLGLVLPSRDRLWVWELKGDPQLYWVDPTTRTWLAWLPSPDLVAVFDHYATA